MLLYGIINELKNLKAKTDFYPTSSARLLTRELITL